MTRGSAALFLLFLAGCRHYDYVSHISDADGMVPGDQMARYGQEQGQAVAIARRFADDQADSAVAFARSLPDVARVTADRQSHRLTVDFKSGWRVGVVPLNDGKSAAETPGLRKR